MAGDRIVEMPSIVIEVLSPSNRNDPDSSLIACANIPSVREMLAVDSQRQFVEYWLRDETGSWPSEPETIVAGGHVTLASIKCTLALADIYAGTHLAGTE